MICHDFDADLGECLLRPLRVAAVRLADVTQGQRHVLQGEITGRRTEEERLVSLREALAGFSSKHQLLLETSSQNKLYSQMWL